MRQTSLLRLVAGIQPSGLRANAQHELLRVRRLGFQVLCNAVCAVANVLSVGSADRVQCYVDGGTLLAVVSHMSHPDEKVRPCAHNSTR